MELKRPEPNRPGPEFALADRSPPGRVPLAWVQKFSHAVHLVPASFGQLKFPLRFRKLGLQLLALFARRRFQLLPKRLHLCLTVLGLFV